MTTRPNLTKAIEGARRRALEVYEGELEEIQATYEAQKVCICVRGRGGNVWEDIKDGKASAVLLS